MKDLIEENAELVEELRILIKSKKDEGEVGEKD